MKFLLILVLICYIGNVYADVYLLSGGSNNRLNEQSATRTQNDRLMDTQNNARGGVNHGSTTANANSNENALTDMYGTAPSAGQYYMSYYEGSELTLAWTNQHGCGGNAATDPHNLNCNIVIQYTCDSDTTKAPFNTDAGKAMTVALKNGQNTNRPNAQTNAFAAIAGTRAGNAGTGRHEDEQYYFECANRNRNTGLFTADRNLKNTDARSTRQNENGNQNGLECPEERDYYPYWGPTPWKDVAYLTSELPNSNVSPCGLVQRESQNVKSKFKCVGGTNSKSWNGITKDDCENNSNTAAENGVWTEVSSWGLPPPRCEQAAFSRDNHLGNTRDGQFLNITWTLPTWTQLTQHHAVDGDKIKCVARIRYNITTSDYDPWNTFSTSNNGNLITNNPTKTIGADIQGLKLAINTAQTGRTFQDRTHIFTVRRRPTAVTAATRIHNLNVIGKRGNIAQTFPSIEYWFLPHTLTVKTNDIIHIQWTGSNTHNNGANGGDGQTGDDGQGQGGTDRSNFVLMYSEGENWPIALDNESNHMWKHTLCWRPANPTGATNVPTLTQINSVGTENWIDCALAMATSGYYTDRTAVNGNLNNQMNNASPSLINGMVIQILKPGTYYYMSSRNNNFTNRSQKGVIIVV